MFVSDFENEYNHCIALLSTNGLFKNLDTIQRILC